MGDTKEIFTLAHQVEDVAGRIYALLARRSSGDEATLFQRMAEEERQHASRLSMLRSMYLKDSRSFAGLEGDAYQLERMARVGLEILERLELEPANARSLTNEQARDRMIALEDAMAVAHAEVLSAHAGSDPSVKSLFEFLATQDREHRKLLAARRKARAARA